MMKLIIRIMVFFICIGILSGLAYAQDPSDNTMYTMNQQNSGIAEPFYPVNVPDMGMNPSDGGLIQIGPSENPVQEPVQSINQPVTLITPEPVSVTPVNSEPVGNMNPDPGTAEPYYPANPPSPIPEPTENPIKITPVYPEPVSQPYYPVPEPTPVSYSWVYHSQPRYYEPYDEPVKTYRGYYDRYDQRYRPSYYDWDDDDCNDWDYSSYYCVDGVLKVASTPYQAEIYVDNTFRGYTPYSGYRSIENIRPGTYTIRLKYSGYYDYYEDVYVSRGRTVYVDADMVRIGETYTKTGSVGSIGSISVQSEPSGAEVYLDNEYKGISPVVLNGVTMGTHTLTLAREGYSDYICKVDVSTKQTVSISAVLTATIPATPVPTVTPDPTPLPEPTKSGFNGVILCVSLIISGILVMRIRHSS